MSRYFLRKSMRDLHSFVPLARRCAGHGLPRGSRSLGLPPPRGWLSTPCMGPPGAALPARCSAQSCEKQGGLLSLGIVQRGCECSKATVQWRESLDALPLLEETTIPPATTSAARLEMARIYVEGQRGILQEALEEVRRRQTRFLPDPEQDHQEAESSSESAQGREKRQRHEM